MKCDLVIIGGGPAGMAAAIAAHDSGIRDMLILERDEALGGILRQCIHNGFGLHRFGEELTGPEYAARYAEMVKERAIPYLTQTMVLSLEKNSDKRIAVTAMNGKQGVFTVSAGAVILAMGCRERSRGALSIPGTRPAGIYTAGTAQRYVNMKGYLPGREIVILGSGDIGLIMARRMTLEGAHVKAVCELMPYSGGLSRNIVQCLDDFGIPLKLSHTVTKVHGTERLTGVTVAAVDEKGQIIPTDTEYIPCDTLLLSCGLLPENELTAAAGIDLDGITGGATVNQNRRTCTEGVYACGNVLHVHDLVDYVSEEGALAGKHAAAYLTNGFSEPHVLKKVQLERGTGVRYTVPQHIDICEGENAEVRIYFRVGNVFRNARVVAKCGERTIWDKKKRKLAPGEMEYISLPEKILESMKNSPAEKAIRLEIVSEEE